MNYSVKEAKYEDKELSRAPPGSYFDSDDMAGLLEAHFEDLSTGPAANLPLVDQVRHLSWMPL